MRENETDNKSNNLLKFTDFNSKSRDFKFQPLLYTTDSIREDSSTLVISNLNGFIFIITDNCTLSLYRINEFLDSFIKQNIIPLHSFKNIITTSLKQKVHLSLSNDQQYLLLSNSQSFIVLSVLDLINNKKSIIFELNNIRIRDLNWLSNKEILYTTTDNQLFSLNIFTKKQSCLRSKSVLTATTYLNKIIIGLDNGDIQILGNTDSTNIFSTIKNPVANEYDRVFFTKVYKDSLFVCYEKEEEGGDVEQSKVYIFNILNNNNVVSFDQENCQYFYSTFLPRGTVTKIHSFMVDNYLYLLNNSNTSIEILEYSPEPKPHWNQLSLPESYGAYLLNSNAYPLGFDLIQGINNPKNGLNLALVLDTTSTISIFSIVISGKDNSNKSTALTNNVSTPNTKLPKLSSNSSLLGSGSPSSLLQKSSSAKFLPVQSSPTPAYQSNVKHFNEKLILQTDKYLKKIDSQQVSNSFETIKNLYLKITNKLLSTNQMIQEFNDRDLYKFDDINSKLSSINDYTRGFPIDFLNDQKYLIKVNFQTSLLGIKEMESYLLQFGLDQQTNNSKLLESTTNQSKLKIQSKFKTLQDKVDQLENQLKFIYQNQISNLNYNLKQVDQDIDNKQGEEEDDEKEKDEQISKENETNGQLFQNINVTELKQKQQLEDLEKRIKKLNIHKEKLITLKEKSIESIIDFSKLKISNNNNKDANLNYESSFAYQNLISTLKRRNVQTIKPLAIDIKKILKPDELDELKQSNKKLDEILPKFTNHEPQYKSPVIKSSYGEPKDLPSSLFTTPNILSNGGTSITQNVDISKITQGYPLPGLNSDSNNNAFSTSKFKYDSASKTTPIHFEDRSLTPSTPSPNKYSDDEKVNTSQDSFEDLSSDEEDENEEEEEEGDEDEENEDEDEENEDEEKEEEEEEEKVKPKKDYSNTPKVPTTINSDSDEDNETHHSSFVPKDSALLFKDSKFPTKVPENIRPSPPPLIPSISPILANNTSFTNLFNNVIDKKTSPPLESTTNKPPTPNLQLPVLPALSTTETKIENIFTKPTITPPTSLFDNTNAKPSTGNLLPSEQIKPKLTLNNNNNIQQPTDNNNIFKNSSPKTDDSSKLETTTTIPQNNTSTPSSQKTTDISQMFNNFGMDKPQTPIQTPNQSPFTTPQSSPFTPKPNTGSVFAPTTTPTSVFEQQQTSVFAPKPTTSNPTPIFNQQQQPTSVFAQQPTTSTPPTTSPFGQQSATSTTSPFGQPSFGKPITGTFGQTSSTPTPSFGTTFGTGQTSAFNSQSSGFGQTNTTSSFSPVSNTNPPPFGQSTFAQSTNPTTVFGQTNNTSTTTPFANTSTPFGQQSTTAFGQTSQQSTNQTTFGATSAFGQPSTTPTTFGATSAFGQPSTTPQTTFGSTSAFGQPSTTPTTTFGSTSAFGQSSNPTSAFGQSSNPSSAFGQSSNPTSAFGQSSNTTSAFGQSSNTTSAFGQSSNPSSAFGQPSNPTSAFGQSSNTTSAFGQSSNPTSVFGQQSATNTTSVFGSQTPNNQPIFGSSFGNTFGGFR